MPERDIIRNIRQYQRKGATYDGLLKMLSVLRDEDLDMLGIAADVRSDIEQSRSSNDALGVAAAVFAYSISNQDLTKQDRAVIGQIFGVASGTILNGYLVTKGALANKQVLTAPDIWTNIATLISGTSTPFHHTGDAIDEEMLRIVDYIEAYNRYVESKRVSYFKSGARDETIEPGDDNWLSRVLDYIPGVDFDSIK